MLRGRIIERRESVRGYRGASIGLTICVDGIHYYLQHYWSPWGNLFRYSSDDQPEPWEVFRTKCDRTRCPAVLASQKGQPFLMEEIEVPEPAWSDLRHSPLVTFPDHTIFSEPLELQ
jgi:hypothetical protein